MAATQYFKARKVHHAWREAWGDKEMEKQELLGMPGAFFVVMGGYAVDSSNHSGKPWEQRDPLNQTLGEGAAHQKSSPALQDAELVTTISADGFISLLKNQAIPTRIREGRLSKSYFDRYTIQDKGNSNNLAKTIVLMQIMWMVVQLIGRISAGLPVTLLEAHVAIQIPFAVAAYAFWWSKPLDIDVPIFLPLDGGAMQGHDVRTETQFERRGQPFITERTSHSSVIHMIFRVWYDIVVFFDWRAELVSAITAVLNAGLHLIVWNSHFPSPTERLLWRLSAIGVGLFPILIYLAIRKRGIRPYGIRYFYEARLNGGSLLRQAVNLLGRFGRMFQDACYQVDLESKDSTQQDGWPDWMPAWSRFMVLSIFVGGLLSYTLSMVYLIIEAFISLRSLPVGAYSNLQWSNIFPHF
ncbi:hypothetical protein BDV24DRAFT_165936 [Aspergillus arachidicola]|uniref:Uncharacterized protein n=1 Tax=Aspergillus arachidicola TaxID=656916 RepID=A0A2G7FRB0_9EURO|nr:hypothetical protein BDV24DRAFT_165936 [Aspergillus arachidicola]PIG83158.1 hypothetical protein AARAC_010189 [Aspergillus arachidicola]